MARLSNSDVEVLGDTGTRVALSSGLTRVLEAVPGGALVVDSRGEIVWINREALHMTGLTRERAIGRTLTGLLDFYVEEDVPCPLQDHPVSRFIRDGHCPSAVTLGMRPRGDAEELSWAIFRTAPLGEGPRSGAIVTFADVTSLKRAAQRELEVATRMRDAQKLESLGVLAGGIAHDFNNILAGILGNAAVARLDTEPTSAIYDALRDIEDAARHAVTLCKQLLAYSGQGALLVRPADLNKIVHQASALLSISVARNARLTYSCASNLPLVSIDSSQIRQVMMNVVLNASEALEGKPGSINIRTKLVTRHRGAEDVEEEFTQPELPEGAYVVLEVEDDGCGMDESTQVRIFDPFFTTKVTGRGLGMAAVMGIIRGHGGAVQVRSKLGQGTTVRVSLPAHHAQTRPTAKRRPFAGYRGRGVVLVIDDEIGVRRVADRMLQRFGFSVRLASDGLEGLAYFREHKDEVAVVLLDLTMPRLSGEETFRLLRELRNDVPIILSSGYSSDCLDDDFMLGPTKFLQKPYDPEALAASLQALLPSEDTAT